MASSFRADFSLIKGDGINNEEIGIIKTYDVIKKYGFKKEIYNLAAKSREKGSSFYCSHNSIILDKEKKINFCLNRIKLNYIIYCKKK